MDDFDPRCECDAPMFVDFTNMTSEYNDNADEWFDQHIEDVTSNSSQDEEGVAPVFTEDTVHTPQVQDERREDKSLPTEDATKEPSTTKRAAHTMAIKAMRNINTMCKSHATNSTKKEVKSTEQLQLEEIKRLQAEAKKKLKSSRRSFQRLAKGSKPIKRVKGSKPPTEIKEFSFSKMDKKPVGNGGEQVVHPSDFARMLRSRHPSDTCEPHSCGPKKPPTPDPPTRPKPFKFELDKRPGLGSGGTAPQNPPFSKSNMPMAEFIAKFQTSTPPRFRRVPTKRKASETSESYSSGTRLTNPKTPKLLTKTRARPIGYKGQSEAEEEEVAKMKQYQFKAKPLNPHILHMGGLLGVPRKRTDPNYTNPVSPQLATKKIAMARKALRSGEEQPDYDAEDRKFTAQPMPDFTEIKGLPTKRTRPVTQPETPTVAKRRHLDDSKKEEEEQSHVIKANPVPNFDKRFVLKYPQRVIEPQPFSFEERDKAAKVEKALPEEKPVFKAQPIPNTNCVPFVPKLDTTVTKPQPFNLHTDIRGEEHSKKWKEQVERQFQQEKEAAEFKARDVYSHLYSKPFSPEKSTKPLTRVENVVLHSEIRSSQRAVYDKEKTKRFEVLETENLQRRALREAEEAKEITTYRKNLVHKAKPINQYAPIVIKPSTKPVTEPISPNFEVDKVLRKKYLGSESN